MIRYIVCDNCGPRYGEEEDRRMRKLTMIAKKPAVHQIRTTTFEKDGTSTEHAEDLPTLRCDLCNKPLPDGTTMVAITYWRDLETEPPMWEFEYATPQGG